MLFDIIMSIEVKLNKTDRAFSSFDSHLTFDILANVTFGHCHVKIKIHNPSSLGNCLITFSKLTQ